MNHNTLRQARLPRDSGSILYFLVPGDVWTLHDRRNECVRLRRAQGAGVCEGEDVSTEEREEENLFMRNAAGDLTEGCGAAAGSM